MIPKIVHQTFKNNTLPILYKKCQSDIKLIYDDFDYKFYNDDDMNIFMEHFDPIFKHGVFDKLPVKIMQIDVFRYCLIYKFGGLYSDMDYQVTKKFDFSNIQVALPISVSAKTNNDFVIGNCFFASISSHPFWKKLIDEIIENIDRIIADYKLNKKSLKKFVLNTTGPGFITSIYKKYFINDPSISLLDKHMFHPPRPTNEKEIKELYKTENTFGFHHCYGSWLK